MEERVGTYDSLVRTAGGLVLGFLSVFSLADACAAEAYSAVFGFLALYMLVTGLSRKDPVMELTGCDSHGAFRE